jgi:hypothetical protein
LNHNQLLNYPEGVGRGAGVGRTRGVGLGRTVGVGLAVDVAVAVAVGLTVAVAVTVAVGVAVTVAVGVTVTVTVAVAVAVGVGVIGGVGVAVQGGPWQPKTLTVSTRQPSLAPLVSLAIRQRNRTSTEPFRFTTLVTNPPELPLQARRPAIGLPRSELIVRL